MPPAETLGAVLILRDHADATRIHAARLHPVLARRGPPALRLVHWLAQDEAGRGAHETGGHLYLEVDLEPTEAELAEAGLRPAHVRPIPWIEATARLDVPGAEPIVTEASALSGGRATFATPLTTAQAGRLIPLLRPGSPTPLQVTWSGRVRARLPAAEVTASVDTSQVSTVVTSGDTTIIRARIAQHLHIRIVGAQDPAIEQALRQWAIDALSERLVAGRDLLVRVTLGDVVRWPIELAGTLALDDDLEGMVTERVLPPDAHAEPPPVRVSARGPVGTAIDRVDVELRIGDGEARALSLTDEAGVAIALPRGELWSRHRVVVGDQRRAFTPWRSSGALRILAIPLTAPRPRQLEVLAGAIDLRERWRAARVTLTTSTGRSHVLELDAATGSRRLTLPDDDVDASVRYEVTFLSRDGVAVHEGPHEVEHDQVVLRDPMGHHQLTRTLLPVGEGWEDVALVMVDLRHEDGAHVILRTAELRERSDLAVVELPIREDAPRAVRWRVHASFRDGAYARQDWQHQAETDGASSILAIALPRP